MLDFTELPKDGEAFELLVRELLFIEGHNAFWSGRGPDRGSDLICDELLESRILNQVRRWLVQCKHFAHSGRAVGVQDLDNIVDSCAQHGVAGYLLACSTVPSSAVVERLASIAADGRLVATVWDATAIERRLRTPRGWAIAQRFFPRSATQWQVYGTQDPNRWIGNYRGYFFYLANRIGSSPDLHLEAIATVVPEVEAIELPQDHLLRLRAVYYDDKHGHYTWFLDHLYPREESIPDAIAEFKARLHDGASDANGLGVHHFDIVEHPYFVHSDHHDPDHYQYYRPYLGHFNWGTNRE